MNYYNCVRRHSSLDYRSPLEYLISKGIVPKRLAENGAKSDSAPGVQASQSRGSKVHSKRRLQ